MVGRLKKAILPLLFNKKKSREPLKFEILTTLVPLCAVTEDGLRFWGPIQLLCLTDMTWIALKPFSYTWNNRLSGCKILAVSWCSAWITATYWSARILQLRHQPLGTNNVGYLWLTIIFYAAEWSRSIIWSSNTHSSSSYLPRGSLVCLSLFNL